MRSSTKPRIVVLGGGFGGLETAFYLRWRLGERADITLISDKDRFLFKPNTIYIPFGLDPEKLMIRLDRPTRRKGITLVQARAREIDPAAKVVHTEDGHFAYNFLVVATGAGTRPEEIPGLREYAETIWTPEAMLGLRAAFARLLADARQGQHRKVLFVVPPNNKCAGPLYELLFMLDTWLRRNRGRAPVDITWTTYEQSYIQAFGPRLHEVASGEFRERGIAGYTGYTAVHEREQFSVRCARRVSTLRRLHAVRGPPAGRARVPPNQHGDPPGRRQPEHLCGGRRGRLPGEASLPRVSPGRCGRGAPGGADPRDAGHGGVRSGQHVRHGAVRQGDVRPGAAPPDRQPREADRGAA